MGADPVGAIRRQSRTLSTSRQREANGSWKCHSALSDHATCEDGAIKRWNVWRMPRRRARSPGNASHERRHRGDPRAANTDRRRPITKGPRHQDIARTTTTPAANKINCSIVFVVFCSQLQCPQASLQLDHRGNRGRSEGWRMKSGEARSHHARFLDTNARRYDRPGTAPSRDASDVSTGP